jgi:hypothetical protein
MVEEFRWQLDLAAASGLRLLAWHNIGDDGAGCGGLLLALVPNCGVVVSCFVRLFAWLFVCGCVSLQHVMYNCFLLPLIFL